MTTSRAWPTSRFANRGACGCARKSTPRQIRLSRRPNIFIRAPRNYAERCRDACGEWIEGRPGLFKLVDRVVNRGRRVRTHTVTGYLSLAFVAGLGRGRRNTLRHARETAHREAWLGVASRALEIRYEVGVEALACRRLVKGYSDTHARGLSKIDRVLAAVPALSRREDGAAWLDRLKRAALADETGAALDGVLKTIATL